MVDTHCHLGICEPPAGELVAAATEAGVGRILTVGIVPDQNRVAVADAEEHEGVFACVGHHPNAADEYGDETAEQLRRLAGNERVAAIGETGLDWFRKGAEPEAQRAAFSSQLEIAGEAGLPVVIHLRDRDGKEDAYAEAFETLAAEARGDVILHCFSAGPEWAERAADRGWYCSFAGNATYAKAGEIREAAKVVPDDRVLVETDSPFLSPQPMRGDPNQPANVVATAERIAEVRGASLGDFSEQVERNAARVFGW